MRAAMLLRSGDSYRADVFSDGLRRHGFVVEAKWQRYPDPTDILVLWNRARSYEPVAEMYQRAGARILIVENGYTPPREGGKHYALAWTQHNGAGEWFVGDEPRHEIPERPWRSRGDHVLILPQRGIGALGVAMPSAWPKGALDRVRAITDRPVVFRRHPGHRKRGEPDTLPDDLANAHCAVTWGSGAAIKALQAGVPVFHEFEKWIGAPAARRLDRDLEDCHTPDRRLAWTRISWAQWKLDEIATGEAFDGLLNAQRGGLFCAEQQSLDDHRAGDGGRCEAVGSGSRSPLVAQL
jgi:hypothetical protein